MILVAFRSRLSPEAQSDYAELVPHMSALARTMPGYVSHKGYVAEDGERLTLVEFESEEALHGWAAHAEHVQAKKLGRKRFYSEYRVQIAKVIRDSSFNKEQTESSRT